MENQLSDSFSRLLLLPACETMSGLFRLSREKGYDSRNFIDIFMKSDCAYDMDDLHDINNWMGFNYAMNVLEDEVQDKLFKSENLWPSTVLEWIAFVYRHWSATKTIPSSEIVRIADAQTMYDAWFGYHTLDIDDAINNLIEDAEQPEDTERPVVSAT